MRFRPIIVDNQQQELTQHGTVDFPISMDRQLVADDGCKLIPHWHYEIQISLITNGSVCFRTPVGDTFLSKGEGIFINSAVLHEVIPTAEEASIYECVNFHPNLIYGSAENMIRRDYVDPVLFSRDLPVVILRDLPWQQEICRLLEELSAINESKIYGYEVLMKSLLCKIWFLIIANNRPIIEKQSSITFNDRQRLKLLQDFIQKNYMDRITLKDIAKAGHISRGECCRFFQRILKTSPITYLTNYRISQSIKLLTCTDLSICDIALQTGFSSSSYYAECFRQSMGLTPLQYRKQHQNDGNLSVQCGNPDPQFYNNIHK